MPDQLEQVMLQREFEKQHPAYDSTLLNILSKLGLDGYMQNKGRQFLLEGGADGPDSRGVRAAQTMQYQHPERDILPRSPYKPTSLTKFQDQVFRSEAGYLPQFIYLPSEVSNIPVSKLKTDGPIKLSPEVSGKIWGDPPQGDDIGFDIFNDPRRLEKVAGLGHGTLSLGYDKDKDKPYLSIFDSWDFDPKEQGNGEVHDGFSILKTMGQPFNIYDRVYFTPSYSNGHVPKMIRLGSTLMPGDIELPAERGKK
jgi:hypothetical protein